MVVIVALILSVILQLAASIIVLSLVRKTRLTITWMLISAAFVLMAARRIIELFNILNAPEIPQMQFAAWLAFAISLLMFVGAFYIQRIFNIQKRIELLRKENDAKVLSAILKTEETERQKFSEELHDGLGPILSSIKLGITAIDKNLVGDKNTQIIERTESNLDNAIASVKEISNRISPQILKRYGLDKAVNNFIDSLNISDKLEIEYSSNIEDQRFSFNVEVVVYRIVGELITNTIKHASATEAEVSLFVNHQVLELFYIDNGVGFDMVESRYKGLGLFNLKSRVKSLGGEITMFSKLRQGFYLKISIPV